MRQTFLEFDLYLRILLTCWLFFCSSPIHALTIEVRVEDRRPIFALELYLTLSGPIEDGDALRINNAILQNTTPETRNINVFLDSPGGSLWEGMEIARILRDRPEVVSVQVGTFEQPDAECASACVVAYLGGDLRYIEHRGKIGVHRFSDPSGTVKAEVGIAVTQRLTARIVDLLNKQGVSTELFEAMSNTPADQILWIDRERLRRWRVVTGPVLEEWMEYRNLNGKVALYIFHRSIYGTNEMTLFCADGLVAYAILDEPEVTALGSFAFVADGQDYPIFEYELLDRTDGRTRVFLQLPNSASLRLRTAATLGAKAITPSGSLFWGFEQKIFDGRVKEMAESCALRAERSSMTILSDTDLVGYDLTPNGYRDISFEQCKAICKNSTSCQAVSYVENKRWCWPKGKAGPSKPAPGITSAYR